MHSSIGVRMLVCTESHSESAVNPLPDSYRLPTPWPSPRTSNERRPTLRRKFCAHEFYGDQYCSSSSSAAQTHCWPTRCALLSARKMHDSFNIYSPEYTFRGTLEHRTLYQCRPSFNQRMQLVALWTPPHQPDIRRSRRESPQAQHCPPG